MEEEVKSLVDKVKLLKKSVEREKNEREQVNALLLSSEAKLEEMVSQSSDMNLLHDELMSKIKALTEVRVMFNTQLFTLKRISHFNKLVLMSVLQFQVFPDFCG